MGTLVKNINNYPSKGGRRILVWSSLQWSLFKCYLIPYIFYFSFGSVQ